jgi:TrmH family RNA methyltransferase
MISKNRIKFIRSLHRKKERIQHRKFIIEGEKPILELLSSEFPVDTIYCSRNYIENHPEVNAVLITDKEMESISTLKTFPGILAVCDVLQWQNPNFQEGKYVMLDRINDPGNLGTIIRIADWYGLNGIICSSESVDLYNPKVIQASMGSIFRVPVFYEDLILLLPKISKTTEIIGADMQGESINKFRFPKNGILLMGSESHGISNELHQHINQKVTIPRYGKAESLNVAVATGILVNQFVSS